VLARGVHRPPDRGQRALDGRMDDRQGAGLVLTLDVDDDEGAVDQTGAGVASWPRAAN